MSDVLKLWSKVMALWVIAIGGLLLSFLLDGLGYSIVALPVRTLTAVIIMVIIIYPFTKEGGMEVGGA